MSVVHVFHRVDKQHNIPTEYCNTAPHNRNSGWGQVRSKPKVLTQQGLKSGLKRSAKPLA